MEETLHSLEEIHLQVGDLFQLQAQQENAAVRYHVKLIGYAKGASLLVTAPTIGGRMVLLRQDQPLVVRSFSGKSVYAFATSVLKVVNTPYPYLHLAFPERVRGLVVRRGARVAVSLPARVHAEGGGSTEAQLANISISGALLRIDGIELHKDQRIEVQFDAGLNGLDLHISAPAVVRSIDTPHERDTGAVGQFGIEWSEVSDNHQIMLCAFVYHQLLEQGGGL